MCASRRRRDLIDFDREDVDVAVRYGRGNWSSDLRSDLLIRESMFPVCSPKLLEGPLPLKTIPDLRHHTLLTDYDWRVDFWQLWLDAAGITDLVPQHSLSFNYSNLMLQAAIDGLGVALTPERAGRRRSRGGPAGAPVRCHLADRLRLLRGDARR